MLAKKDENNINTGNANTEQQKGKRGRKQKAKVLDLWYEIMN